MADTSASVMAPIEPIAVSKLHSKATTKSRPTSILPASSSTTTTTAPIVATSAFKSSNASAASQPRKVRKNNVTLADSSSQLNESNEQQPNDTAVMSSVTVHSPPSSRSLLANMLSIKSKSSANSLRSLDQDTNTNTNTTATRPAPIAVNAASSLPKNNSFLYKHDSSPVLGTSYDGEVSDIYKYV